MTSPTIRDRRQGETRDQYQSYLLRFEEHALAENVKARRSLRMLVIVTIGMALVWTLAFCAWSAMD